MNFVHPWVLLMLPAALFFLREAKPVAITVSSLSDWREAPSSWKIRWRGRLRFFHAAAFALLVTALAGPRLEWKSGEEIRQGVAIEILFDCSFSMSETITAADGDKLPRLDAGKKALETFINNRRDDLTGLISFARYADTRSPLTFGHDALVEIVRELAVQDLPNEDGTAYGDALFLACARLRQMDDWKQNARNSPDPIRSKVIVLFTDGENNCGLHLPMEAAALAKKWGIRIYCIKMSDSDGRAPTKTAPTGVQLNDAERMLQAISGETGGEFWKIHDEKQLAEVYENIDRLEKSRIKNTTVFRTEHALLFPWFVLPALLLLAAGQILESTILRVAEEVGA